MAEQPTTFSREEQTEPNQDQDQQSGQPELVKTVKIMERLHATEIFGTPEQSKAFLDSLDYDEFKRYISFVNGVERGIPTTERGEVSNSHVQSESGLLGVDVEYRPPHQSFRDPLLKMAFEKAQEVESPEMAGLTLGLSINAIHYFEDGNGRTARMTYALLSKGYNGSPQDQAYYSQLLENTTGREVINPAPAASGIDRQIRAEMFGKTLEKSGYGEAFGDKIPTYVFDGYPEVMAGEYSPEELAVSDDIDDQGRLMLYNAMESGGMTMISIMATFSPDRVKDFIKTSPDGERIFIDGNEFLPTLTKEEITEWWSTSEHAIANYVKRLINVADRDDAPVVAAHYSSDAHY